MHHISRCLTSRRRVRGRSLAVAAATAVATGCLLALPRAAAAQDVRFTLLPSASYVRWDEALGLERTTLLGGRAAADFGSLVTLEGYYLTRPNVTTSFQLTPGGGGTTLGGETDVTNYGLGVRLNFGSGRVAPFVRGGGGVFQVKPEGGEDAKFLALTYGGGLRMDLTDRVRAQIFAEDARLRVDRTALLPSGGTAIDPDRDKLRRNLVIGAGLGVALGPPLLGDTRGPNRWSFASVPIEPFVGTLRYDESALADQSLAGARLGIDVGPLVGLRGFYWRGVTSSFSSAQPVQSYGGEAQFNLNALPVIAPYLIVGGGTLDFRSDFRDDSGSVRDDKTVVILGGGIGLRLTDQFRLNIAARDNIYTDADRLEDAARANDLRHNWLYSAGLTFNVGRGMRGLSIVRAPEPPDSARIRTIAAEAARNAVAETMADSARVRQGRMDDMRMGEARMGDARMGDTRTVDTVRVRDLRTRDTVYVNEMGGVVERAAATGSSTGYVSGRTVTIPVPTEGELYVRYGRSSGGAVPNGLRVSPSGDTAYVPVSRAAIGLSPATGGAGEAMISVPMRRDANGTMMVDSLALRDAVRRMIEAERRAAGPPPPTSSLNDEMRMRTREDSLRVRDIAQRAVQQELDRQLADDLRRRPLTASARPAAPAAPAAPSTVIVRDDPVRVGTDPALSSQLVRNERERAQAEVMRLRQRVDSLERLYGSDTGTAGTPIVREELARLQRAQALAASAELAEARATAAAAMLRAETAERERAESMRRAETAERDRTESMRRVERMLAAVATVRETSRGMMIVLGDGAFASGQATLSPRARRNVGVMATAIAQFPDAPIEIAGHTDASGDAAANLRLSERRANAVRDALISLGVGADRVIARGFGETMPVAENGTAAGRAMNRRAEVLVVGARSLSAPRP